jgi:hypothetical protein
LDLKNKVKSNVKVRLQLSGFIFKNTHQDEYVIGYIYQLPLTSHVEIYFIMKTSQDFFYRLGFRFMVFNVTFNNISVISWQSVWIKLDQWSHESFFWKFFPYIVLRSTMTCNGSHIEFQIDNKLKSDTASEWRFDWLFVVGQFPPIVLCSTMTCNGSHIEFQINNKLKSDTASEWRFDWFLS